MKTNKGDAWINRLSYAWLLLFTGLGLWVLLHRSEASVARPDATIDRSHTSTAHHSAASVDSPARLGRGAGAVPTGYRNIEDVHVGQRVFATNPEISDEERAAWEEPDWSHWRRAKLEMTKPDGGVLQIEMLRPREWFALEAAEPGAEIWLDLPEMGAEGPARVVAISECPPIRSGPGQVVTATFAHPPSTAVLDVRFEGEPQPIGVTDNHLFWSVEGEEFLPIGQMAEGDHVLTYSGDTKRIESKHPRPGPEVVYNLEVYAEHVYFVGSQGLLAHNSYTDNLPVSRDQYGWRDARGRFTRGPVAEETLASIQTFRRGSRVFTLEQGNASSGWKHIWDRHVNPTRFVDKSKFGLGVSQQEILDRLSNTLRHGSESIYEGQSVFTKRIRMGSDTSWYRATVNPDGTIQTFHTLD